MAADATQGCSGGEGSLFFELAGRDVKWRAISLTHIEYPEGDLLGKCLAWISLLPIFIFVGFITLILFRRELHTMTFAGGIVVNEVVNMVLKRVMSVPRPCGSHVFIQSSSAMPSDHSQYMAFFAVYTVLFLYFRLPHSQTPTFWDDLLDNVWRHFVALGVVFACLVVGFSRIYLKYHTFHQVVGGYVAGSLMGVIWFLFTQMVLTPLFPSIVACYFPLSFRPIAECLLIRDSTLIPSVMWFEYTQSRSEMRKRHRRGSHNSYCKSHSS